MATLDKPLFFYGTLRDRDVLEIVVGRPVPAAELEPARLPGHRVARVPDETYPVLVPAAQASAPGVAFEGFNATELDRILFFESFEYAPRACTVIGRRRGAFDAHVFAEARMVPGATEPWSLAQWQRGHKSRFIALTRSYMALYGTATLEEADALWEALEGAPDTARLGTG